MIISDWDSECYMGRDSSDSESIYNTTEMHTGPENKKDCPCDSCPLSLQCMQNVTECSAFRNWASKGDYWDTAGWDTKLVVKKDKEGKPILDKKTKKPIKEIKRYWRKSDVGLRVRSC